MSLETSPTPNLEFEKTLGARYIVGLDEVGRGCIAGPVVVGAVLLDLESTSTWPAKLKDSKLLSEKTREEIFLEVCSFPTAYSTGEASCQEIENHGIIDSLGLACLRAIDELTAKHPDLISKSVFVLDGIQNYLSFKPELRVITKVKADASCVSVAAASVIAKVVRDRQMIQLAGLYPGFDLESNKGYASAKHRKALLDLGPTEIHRKSWLGKILQG